MNHKLIKNSPAAEPSSSLVLAHGAGAPMDSEFMNAMSELLCQRGCEVIRFEFPYMAERRVSGGRRPPNPTDVLLKTWRELVAELRQALPDGRTLIIGGKSMGGRMASMVADELGAEGLVCLGYPFHPAGKPERLRIDHLRNLTTPALFIQGTRDPLGNFEEVSNYPLAEAIQVHWLPDGDHDFKPRVKSGYTQMQHWTQAADLILNFIQSIAKKRTA